MDERLNVHQRLCLGRSPQKIAGLAMEASGVEQAEQLPQAKRPGRQQRFLGH
jgi:hypothetical protein